MMTSLFRRPARPGGRLFAGLVAVSVAAALAGCADAPADIQVTLKAGPMVNPDVTGTSMPVQVNVYLLKSTAKLESADYFQLTDASKHVLDDDIVATQQVVVRPGTTQMLTFKPTDQAKYIGVIAGYQKIDNAKWRNSLAIPDTGKAIAGFGYDAVNLQKVD